MRKITDCPVEGSSGTDLTRQPNARESRCSTLARWTMRIVDWRMPQERMTYTGSAAEMIAALEVAGVDSRDFGSFGSFLGWSSTFDYASATPILIEWLPRIEDPRVIESIARSLTGQPGARGEGARRLIASFRKVAAAAPERGPGWAIGNALSTLAGPDDASDIIELLRDRRYGTARQMLCDALTRTRDPRAVGVLIELIDDDDLSGHATSALRRLGRWTQIPDVARARPRLEAVLERPTATVFARKQARKALEVAGPIEADAAARSAADARTRRAGPW